MKTLIIIFSLLLICLFSACDNGKDPAIKEYREVKGDVDSILMDIIQKKTPIRTITGTVNGRFNYWSFRYPEFEVRFVYLHKIPYEQPERIGLMEIKSIDGTDLISKRDYELQGRIAEYYLSTYKLK